MVKLTFNNKTFEYPKDKDLFVLQKDTGIYIASSCYKQGLCKECIIKIEKGAEFLNAPTKNEKHLKPPYRLACQTKIVKDNCHVQCSTLKRDEIVIEDSYYINDVDQKYLNINPAVKRDDENNIILNGKKIDKTKDPILGLAIDIGTTTIVLKLIDLEKAKVIKTVSFENPQRFAGSNVMSRIYYDTNDRTKQLKRIINSYIYNAIRKMTGHYQNIYEVVVGGNTTMRDIFFGIDVSTVGQSPYISLTELKVLDNKADTTAIFSTGRKSRLPVHPKATVFSLPLIGSHIGSDISAGLIAVDFYKSEKWQLFIDIGTNTEMVLGKNDIAFAASSPSGPAFEGGGITYGMPALKGAIEKVTINTESIDIKTIANTEPTGICGSGLIDILGELRRNAIIDTTGRFTGEHEQSGKFYLSKEIFIDENDISQLAQAKGANSAALQVLLDKANININDVDKIFLAGGFGRHIDLEQAISIGLLPQADINKFKRIGNSCIQGLTLALTDQDKRQEINEYLNKITKINLETDSNFFDYFVEGCLFVPMGSYEIEETDFLN